MAANEEVTMMMSVVPGAMTGISTMMSGLVSINNVFLDMTRQIDATFGLIDSSVVTAGTVVAQLGFKAAEAFGEFEQGMKVVQMVSNQTSADMDILKQKANEFSVSYRTDIDQITEGLQTLGRAGLNSAAEQTEVLQNGLSTAKLESRDLNSVLEELIQNTALLGGNLKSSDFGEVSTYLNDLLVATSMTAPITTHDVSETLKYSGGIAAAAGANVNTDEGKALLEDYMAAIAAFAQKGVTGSIAGTALRAFFTKPASQDSSVTDALSSLHLKPEYLWEDDEQTMKPVSEQIRIIKNQMDELNVSTMDQLQIWSKIVGGKMGQQMMKLDSSSIKEITKDIQAADSAQSKAAGTFKTFQSNMKEMTEQGQVAFREFGENVTRVLNPLIGLITKFLEVLSNPVSSATLFVGFMAIIGQAYQKIKNIFNSLKTEFSTIMDYIGSSSKLMAMRPSYDRYHGTKSKTVNELMNYHQEDDPAKAFEKEFRLKQAEAKLSRGKDNNFTPAMYSLFDKSFGKKLSQEYDINKKNNDLYPSEIRTSEAYNILNSIFEGTNQGIKKRHALGLDKSEGSLNWGFVIRELMTRGLWKDEWSDAFFDPEKPLNEKEFITNSGQEMLDTLVNSHDYKKIKDSYDTRKNHIEEKSADRRRKEVYSMFHLLDDKGSAEDQYASALNNPLHFSINRHDSAEENKAIKGIIDNYFIDKESVLGTKVELDELKYHYKNDDLEAIRTQLRTRDRKAGRNDQQNRYLYDKLDSTQNLVAKETDSILGTYINKEAERSEEALYYMLHVYEDVFYGQNGIGPAYFSLMTTEEVRTQFRKLTGKKYLDVKNEDIQAAQKLIGDRIFGSSTKYDAAKRDSDSQSAEIISYEERFNQPYYRDYLRGYRTTKRYNVPSGEWEEVAPQSRVYFNTETGKREQLSKKQYRMIRTDFEERQYYKESLFGLMKKQKEMDDIDMDAFVLMSHSGLENIKGAFQYAKSGKALTYKIPYELLTSDREIDYNEFTYLRLNDTKRTRISQVLAAMSPSKRRESFESFKNTIEERRKDFNKLKGLASYINLTGTDSFLPKLKTSTLNDVKLDNEGSKILLALHDVFNYNTIDNKSRDEIINGNGVLTKKSLGNLKTNLSRAGLSRFEQIDLSKIDDIGVSRYKVLQKLAKLFEIKANQSGENIEAELEGIIEKAIQNEKDKNELYKKYGNAYGKFDDSELLKEFQAFKEWQERKKNYNVHMEDNPYAGATPGSYGQQTEDVLDYQKKQQEKEEKEKEKRDKEVLDKLREENLSLLGEETRKKGHEHYERQKSMNQTLKEMINEPDNSSSELLRKLKESQSKSGIQKLMEKFEDEGTIIDRRGLQQKKFRDIAAKVRNEGIESLSFEELNEYAKKNDVSQKYLRAMRKVDESREKLERGLDRIDKDWEKLGYKSFTNVDERPPEKYDTNFLKENLMSLPAVTPEASEAHLAYAFAQQSFLSKIKSMMPSNPLSGVTDKLSSILFAPREGRLIGSADKNAKLANLTGNLVDLAGGPLMLAIEGVTTAIQLWQQAYENYTEDLKEASEQLKDAYANRDSAESDLRRTYQEGNPDATDEEIDQMIYDTYTTMADDFQKATQSGDMSSWLGKMNLEAEKGTEFEYDEEAADGTMKKKKEEEKDSATKQAEALKENTGALYMATAELNVALSKLSGKMTDSWWGLDGWTGWLTDQWGGAMDKIFKGGSKFSDENEFLLTQSQADENYSGYTEMAGLMMEDFKDAKGNWIKGMRTMMGNDVDDLVQLLPKSNQDWMKSLANSQTGIASMNGRDNAKIQASMKNDSKTWKKLAREYAKLDVNKKTNKSTDKNVKAIRGITQKLQSTLGKGFNETHIKQAAYLMQMQEMYNVAQNSIVPIISTNTSLAGSTLLAANGIGAKTGDTASNAGGTWGTAQVISGLVAIIAKAKAKEVAWQTAYEADPNSTDINGDGNYDSKDKAIIELAQKSNSPDDFAKEAAKLYNTGLQDLTPYNNHGVYSSDHPGLGSQEKNMAPALFIAQVYEAAAKMTGYNYSADDANEYARKKVEEYAGKPLSDIYNTFGKNYTENPAFHKQIIDNYLAATDDDGDGSGGGGSGSGSGNKDKDQGTKKERVDLVLCNKKEIPKLNVNLFKKAPSFTILNKNFKLRDIKVNTQDKPKAVLASIKNAIIDVQKRTDPKIIQDEEAIYDPVGATDGNTPSGTSDVRTNTG